MTKRSKNSFVRHAWDTFRQKKHRRAAKKSGLVLEPLEHRRLLAVVAADADDYAPGDTAIFRADGFQIGETVEFQVLHTDGTPNTGGGHDPWYVVDGGSSDLDGSVDGHLVTSWYVDPDDSAYSTFEVTATGLRSGLEAVDTFTDAPIGNRLNSHQVWDPSINLYVNGLAEQYTEGETASFLLEICVDEADFPDPNPTFETLTFEFDIVLDLDDGPYAFTDLEPFDTTESPTLPSGFSVTETSPDDGDVSVLTPDGSGVTVEVISVLYNGATIGGSGTDNQSWTVTFTIDRPGCVFFVYGGHIAAPGDPLPAAVGGTVPAGEGASEIGGNFQARVGGEGVGDKTVNFKGSDILPLPGIQITKSVVDIDDEGGGPNDGGATVNEAGDIINYQVTATNTGNQDLTNVMVNDPLVTNLALSSGDDSDGVLEVNEVWIYTGSYTVSQSDIDSNATMEPNGVAVGLIDNTATVYTEETEPQSASVQVPISQNPLLSIVKTGMLNDDDGTPGVSAGDTIDYTFAVTNDGNV
ncbi:MAG: DUF11 domain-containing protein, partial [Planctomycetota bacterium]|nr:DUF11 domain-containing protein [Planctomycetota bacterium]